MSDNTRLVARVPIVPDDLNNTNSHKNHELVMDFNENDIYLKKDNEYINITGKLKEEIEQIKGESSIIHIVTEESIPPVSDREENNWYYVILKAKSIDSETAININDYIHYGTTDISSISGYTLLSHNVTDGSSTIKFDVEDGYSPCLYVPVTYDSISFKNNETGDYIEYDIVTNTYVLNSTFDNFISYNVYILKNLEPKNTYYVDIIFGNMD